MNLKTKSSALAIIPCSIGNSIYIIGASNNCDCYSLPKFSIILYQLNQCRFYKVSTLKRKTLTVEKSDEFDEYMLNRQNFPYQNFAL